MKRALIIGASGGIGSALVQKLQDDGVQVTGLSRRTHGFDLTDETSVADLLGGLTGLFDLVVVATGALEIQGASPEKSIRAIQANAMIEQFRVNAIGPALVLKHAQSLLPRKGRSVFAVLSARVGSITDNRLGGWISYRSAKAALNQVIRTAAIELARTHPELACVALHPGTVETEFTRKYLGRHPSVPASKAAGNLVAVLEGLDANNTGRFYDWSGQEVPW